MATIVCQGLQPCLESHIVEPRTLRLKLSSSSSIPQFPQTHELSAMKSCFMDSNTREFAEKKQIIMNHHHHHLQDNNNQNSKNSDLGGGWSFLQALSHQVVPKVDKETIYVHPLVKRSSSTLSEKSLELCTENLGNETGTDMIESNIFSEKELSVDCFSTVVGNDYLPQKEEQSCKEEKQSQPFVAKKATDRSFPPPLTTIRGRDSLQVRPQRENGRLIIKAVKAPLKQSCFQAERSNGRLRLCLLENFAHGFDSEFERATINGEEIFSENEIEEDDENDSKEEEEEGEEEDDGEQVGEEKRDEVEVGLEKEMDGNYVKAGGETGIMEKYGRPSCRCKEGSEQENKTVVLNWEPLLVTS
ncbi:protein FANTASTIC FOUR 1 [Ziziphus jujuba]|uniref:Protein FANTASTIC FOUR 1 n=1 Tax=Ziziphus jujuba TaxID=326968 RepID=A0A6P4AHM1_ZIZJJ|nr:protein FANTASTIC FOUR 1 [Ziziphus jujuba]